MRVTAFILALIGGLVAFLTAFAEMGIGGITGMAGDAQSGLVVHLAFLTAGAAIVGLVGSALMWTSPKAGAWLCVVAVAAGLIGASGFWIPAGLFLALGATFGFLAHRQLRRTAAPVAPPQ